MQYVRRLRLQNLHNARDLGGYATADGGVTKFGVFLRSEAPCELEQADIEALREYGVTSSLDLRSSGEVAMRPSSLNGPMAYYHKSLFNEAVAFAPEEENRDSGNPGGPRGSDGPGGPPPGSPGKPETHDWGVMYRGMAEQARGWAVEVLQLAAECRGALLYHCTTGKDRTGLLSCYLLSIAGAAEPDIVTDYCVSQVYLQPTYRKLLDAGMGNFGADLNAPFFQTPPAAMQSLLAYLNETYGGVVPFLRDAGVSETTMAKIREKFVAH